MLLIQVALLLAVCGQACETHVAPPPRPKYFPPTSHPTDYLGEVLAVTKDSITIRGKPQGDKEPEVTRYFKAGPHLAMGQQDPFEAPVDVYGGILNIEGGSTLDAGKNDIHVSGWAGSPAYAGELNTFAGASSTEAKITANKLYLGFTAGDVTVTIGKSGAPPGNHIYGVLNVQCPVEWHRGVYKPTVHGTQQGTRDRWITSGDNNTFKIKGSATSVEPISAPGVSVNNQYAVLQSDAMFAELPNNNGDKPGLPLVNAKSETMWEWNASKAFYGEAMVWHVKSKAV